MCFNLSKIANFRFVLVKKSHLRRQCRWPFRVREQWQQLYPDDLVFFFDFLDELSCKQLSLTVVASIFTASGCSRPVLPRRVYYPIAIRLNDTFHRVSNSTTRKKHSKKKNCSKHTRRCHQSRQGQTALINSRDHKLGHEIP